MQILIVCVAVMVMATARRVLEESLEGKSLEKKK